MGERSLLKGSQLTQPKTDDGFKITSAYSTLLSLGLKALIPESPSLMV